MVVDARLHVLALHSPREVAEPQGALSPSIPAQLAYRRAPASHGAFPARDVAWVSSWLAGRSVSYPSQRRRYLRVSNESRVSERLADASALEARLADHPMNALLEEVAQNSAHCRLV